jgi:DnaJ like chaperone protein
MVALHATLGGTMAGKVLGALMGATLALAVLESPIGALIAGLMGASLGHWLFDRDVAPTPKALRPPSRDELLGGPAQAAPPAAKPAPPPRSQLVAADLALLQALCPLFIEVARIDSPPVQSEIRVIREFFQNQLKFSARAMDEVRDALKAALASPAADIDAIATRARALVKPALRIEVVGALYELGVSDGALGRSEHELLKRVVARFNVSDEQLQQITRRFVGQGDDAYRALNLQPNASDEEIKSAYRRLATENHPDRSSGRADAFRRVQEAYETLRRLRGL